MSNQRIKDPALYNIQYKARQGNFYLWDGAKKKNLLVGSKISFFCVSSAVRITGGKKGFSVWSNCFTDHDRHNVTLWKKPVGGTAAKLLSGSYNSQKKNFESHGGKYTAVLWGMITGSKDPRQLVKVALSFQGTAVGQIWQYLKDVDIDSQPCVVIDGKGASIPAGEYPGYFKPEFYPTTGAVNGFALGPQDIKKLLPSPFFMNYVSAVDAYLRDQIEDLDEVEQPTAEDENPLIKSN